MEAAKAGAAVALSGVDAILEEAAPSEALTKVRVAWEAPTADAAAVLLVLGDDGGWGGGGAGMNSGAEARAASGDASASSTIVVRIIGTAVVNGPVVSSTAVVVVVNGAVVNGAAEPGCVTVSAGR